MAIDAKVYRLPGAEELRVKSGGLIRILSGGALIMPNPAGEADYYVDSAVSASGDGLTWPTALKTIGEAAALMVAGDRCFIQGSFNEAVTFAVANIWLVGVGPASAAALWTAPDTAAPCLTVSAAANVGIYNMRFRPPVANAAVELSGAAHQFQFVGCRIQGKAGSYYGIRTDGAQSNVHIEGCEFFYCNTVDYGIAISGHTYSGTEPSGWMIEDCLFHSNLKHIECRMRQSIIRNCVFAGKGLIAAGTMAAVTTGIDISGAVGGCNIVTKNFLGGAYETPTYAAGTDDCWVGNTTEDLGEWMGMSNAVPEAP